MEKTARLKKIDRERLWHPFTPMLDWPEDDAPIIAQAQGCKLIDTQGRSYIDGVSSLWANVHGHRHPLIDRAIKEQLDRVAHSTLLGLSNVPSIELAQKLIDVAPPGLTRVFYSDSGSTAMEVALKIAFSYFVNIDQPQRNVFVRFDGAYHGDTLGAVGLGAIDAFHELYRPLLFDAPVAQYPFCYRCPRGLKRESCDMQCLESLQSVLDQHKGTVAAVAIEPLVQGAAGLRVAPAGFLTQVARLTREAGALLICDEVATGFGRTGAMFACEHENVSPDIMALAKGISGGYLPLAATLTSEPVFEAFLGDEGAPRTFFHGHTYTGNPLACAAALASLEVFDSEQVIARLKPKVELFAELLQGFYEHRIVGDVRHIGLMAGIELEPAQRLGTQSPARRVILEARKLGAILRPLGEVLVLMPPLAIDQTELRALVRIARRALSTVEEQGV
ncbi:MAG: adenosylmethionine--8-amino-7-oxononanoate transaminase [Candidatus Alcyoniella australis]|nr:adenosylmethionine--8-amino-7-oxononanoate transaminase [Candidatus Alcyoniella australis]